MSLMQGGARNIDSVIVERVGVSRENHESRKDRTWPNVSTRPLQFLDLGAAHLQSDLFDRPEIGEIIRSM